MIARVFVDTTVLVYSRDVSQKMQPTAERWLSRIWQTRSGRISIQLRAMTMKNKTILGLLLAVCVWGVTANAAQSATTCDRECLRAKVTQLLYAFLKHDVRGLPVADVLRVTENAVEKPLAKVGLVNTVTRLRGFRQDIIDERAGVTGAHVVVEESGAPVLLVVRLKVVADKLTEVELG